MNSEKTQINWTEAQTAELVNAYKDQKDTNVLAERFKRSQRSIVAKLVTEKVYQKAETAKTKGQTKSEVIGDLEKWLQLPEGILSSLDKGSKESLLALQDTVGRMRNMLTSCMEK